MITCVIIDDEPLAVELLQSYVDREPELRLLRSFNDARTAENFLRANKIDLVFLDIQMPHLSGIELLKSLDLPPIVIFTTAYSEYAVQGFELEAIDYLLKPFDRGRFQRALAKVYEYQKFLDRKDTYTNPYLFIKSEYKIIKLNFDDIRYIEGLDDYIKIHTTNSRPILTLLPLKVIIEKLPKEKFSRVHRSYIISYKHIESIQNRTIIMGDVAIPISSTYSDNIYEIIKKIS